MNPTLRPYQEIGADFLASRDRALLADEPGVGKTPQACAALNRLGIGNVHRSLVICPASLKFNWQRELATWCPLFTTAIVSGDTWPVHDNIIILSYNALAKFSDKLRAEKWAVVICDEAHYIKTLDSQRTIQIRGGFGKSPIPAKRIWLLTGTPLLNRPIELYPLLKLLGADFAKKEVLFGNRYCGGFEKDFKGATNIPELREKLATVMLRRTKAEVLSELPAKTRQVIELELGEAGRAQIAEEKNALRESGMSFEEVISGMHVPRVGDDAGVIARLRKAVGLLKVEAAAEHILDVLESEEKVIVFAHHRDVVDELNARLSFHLADKMAWVSIITGSTSPKTRQSAIDAFQTNPCCRVFIGNLQAAGVGITLTAASHVIFVERDWTPGVNTQAEDRAHRYGQTRGVLIQHLVLNGSIDSYMARAVVAKQAILDQILN